MYGNPVSYRDPSGRFGVVGAAIGVVSGAAAGYIAGGWRGAVAGGVIGGLVGVVAPELKGPGSDYSESRHGCPYPGGAPCVRRL